MAFSPTGIAGLYAWYAADNIGTTNGGVVNYWPDFSGSGNNATPPASSNAPTYVQNAINGHAAVLFSSGNYLQCTFNTTTQFDTSTATTFTVFQTLNGTMKQTIFSNCNNVQGATVLIGLNNDSGNQYYDGNLIKVESSGNLFTTSAWQERQDNTSPTLIYQSGSLVASGSTSAGVLTNTSLFIGRSSLGSAPPVTNLYSGYIAEIVAYRRSLSASEASQVDSYLISKYFGSSSSSSSSSGSFSPTSVTGCFIWYNADNIGTTNNNHVFYWRDDSGSGNNLINSATSGSVTNIYVTGVSLFNNHNVVRFSGINSPLSTNVNTSSINISPSSLTLFTVYSTPVMNTQQTLCALDNISDRKSAFAISLNSTDQNILNPSGWAFAYGKGGTLSNNGWFSLSASSTQYGYNIGRPNTLTIRHDRFRPQDKVFAFGLNGVDIATGIALTQYSTNNVFRIGADVSYNDYFTGDIAEIIGYNHQLTDTEVASVYSYLSAKYIASGTPSPSINFHIPSDLSGLFGWYRSTSIGVSGVDGSPVQYWPDDSGSGNYLYVSSASSGSWVFPSFYRSVINGYPVVRFINGQGYSYLQTNPASSTINLTPNNLAIFAVFTSSDAATEQCVYGLDDGSTNTYWYAGLNHSANNSFYCASGPQARIITATANSQTFGTNLYSANNFTIRSDRFYPSTSSVIFGRYAAEIASGYNTTYNITNPIFRLGYNTAAGLSFYGDVAEIVAYNRQLSTYETELVNTYLLNKYTPGNVGSTSLYLYGNTTTGIYKSNPLYVIGSQQYNINSTTLYTGSSQLIISGVPLYGYSLGSTSSGNTLYAIGSLQQYPPITLFLSNNTNTPSGISLYTASTAYRNYTTSLYASGSIASQNANTTLYIGASSTITNNKTLYTLANSNNSSGINLFMNAGSQSSPAITLYMVNIPAGSSLPTNQMTFFTEGLIPPTSTLYSSLYTFASAPGVNGLYDNTTLYLEGGRLSQSMPLTIGVIPSPYPPSGAMSLFVGTPYLTGVYNSNITLYLGNNVSGINSNVKRLYTSGAGGLAGGSISTSPLFTLVIGSGVTSYVSSLSHGISLVTESNTTINNNTSLYIGASSNLAKGINLYSKSTAQNSGYINMYIPGRTLDLNNSTTTYIRGY